MASCKIQLMTFSLISSFPTRLALVFSLSIALHAALMLLPNIFSPSEIPLMRPTNWRMDVRVAQQGGGISHQFEAPQVSQEVAKGEGKVSREKSHVLPKTQHIDAAPQAIQNSAKPIENQTAPPMPFSVDKPAETQQQAEALAGAMTNMVNMQYLLGQMRIFQTLSRTHIKSAVQAQFTEEMFRQYIGAVCTVTLTYATQESITDAKVDCGERRELAKVLFSRINWGALPQPDKYSLAYRQMNITIWFEGFWVNVGLKADD